MYILIAQAKALEHLPPIENFIPPFKNCTTFGFHVPAYDPHNTNLWERADYEVQTVAHPPTRIFPIEGLITLQDFCCGDPENFNAIIVCEGIRVPDACYQVESPGEIKNISGRIVRWYVKDGLAIPQGHAVAA